MSMTSRVNARRGLRGRPQGEIRRFFLGEVEAGAGPPRGRDAEPADREVFEQFAVALARLLGTQLGGGRRQSQRAWCANRS